MEPPSEKFINKIIETQKTKLYSFARKNNIDFDPKYVINRADIINSYYQTYTQKNPARKKLVLVKEKKPARKKLVLVKEKKPARKKLVLVKEKKLVLKREPFFTGQKMYEYFRDMCNYLDIKYYYYETLLWCGPAIMLETSKYSRDKIEHIKQNFKIDTVKDIINSNLLCIRPKQSETPENIEYGDIFSSDKTDTNDRLKLTEWMLGRTHFYLDNTTDKVYTYDNMLLIGTRMYNKHTGWGIVST